MLNKEWFNIIILCGMFGLAFYLFATIPGQAGEIVTQIDVDGSPLAMGNKFAVLFAIPVIALAIYMLLNALPHIAVYKRNITKFYERFYGFKAIILLFLFVVYVINILPAKSVVVNVTFIFVPALAALYFYLGHVLKHIHRNYFIGFLTPWALSNDKLWDKTHRFGGVVLEVCAFFLLISLIFQDYIVEILTVTTVAALLITTVYSYLIFSRDHHHHH